MCKGLPSFLRLHTATTSSWGAVWCFTGHPPRPFSPFLQYCTKGQRAGGKQTNTASLAAVPNHFLVYYFFLFSLSYDTFFSLAWIGLFLLSNVCALCNCSPSLPSPGVVQPQTIAHAHQRRFSQRGSGFMAVLVPSLTSVCPRVVLSLSLPPRLPFSTPRFLCMTSISLHLRPQSTPTPPDTPRYKMVPGYPSCRLPDCSPLHLPPPPPRQTPTPTQLPSPAKKKTRKANASRHANENKENQDNCQERMGG